MGDYEYPYFLVRYQKMFEFLPQNMQGAICQDFGNVKKNEMIKIFKGINAVPKCMCS